MTNDPRMTTNTQTVLRALLGRGSETGRAVITTGLYGLQLHEITKLPNGTLFSILERLMQAGWVERYWEEDAAVEGAGRPRRRFYKLTDKGAERAPQALAESSASAPLYARKPRPSLAGSH